MERATGTARACRSGEASNKRSSVPISEASSRPGNAAMAGSLEGTLEDVESCWGGRAGRVTVSSPPWVVIVVFVCLPGAKKI